MLNAIHHTAVYLSGGGASATCLLTMNLIAARLRSEGYAVTAPADVIGRVPGGLANQVAIARESAVEFVKADVLVLVPGWEREPHGQASRVMAEALRIPVVEWDKGGEEFLLSAAAPAA